MLVEDEHRLLVVDRVHGTETQRTIAVGNQDGVAGDARRALNRRKFSEKRAIIGSL